MPPDTLPADVRAALQRGEMVTAIKLLRAATGLGLKEAKEVLDAHAAGAPVSLPSAPGANSIPPQVLAALERGNKIEAIRLLREASGLGLKDAKDAVEAVQRHGVHAPKTAGEGYRMANVVWWAVVVLIALAAAYAWMRSAA